MHLKGSRIFEIVMFTAAIALNLAFTAWAGPPGPPVLASAPPTPVGGTGIVFATAVGIAAYGYWKSRK